MNEGNENPVIIKGAELPSMTDKQLKKVFQITAFFICISIYEIRKKMIKRIKMTEPVGGR